MKDIILTYTAFTCTRDEANAPENTSMALSPASMTQAVLFYTSAKKYFMQYIWSAWINNFYLNQSPFHQPAIILW